MNRWAKGSSEAPSGTHLRALFGSHRADLVLAQTEEAHDLLDVRSLSVIRAMKVARRRALYDGHQPADALSRLLVPIHCLHAPFRRKTNQHPPQEPPRPIPTGAHLTTLKTASGPPHENPSQRPHATCRCSELICRRRAWLRRHRQGNSASWLLAQSMFAVLTFPLTFLCPPPPPTARRACSAG